MIDMASCLEVSNFIELERQPTTASVVASNFQAARVSRCLCGRYYKYVLS